ncbi:MAG: hypothetical protein ACREQ7_17020 [Candidatus Binatia bacterium]
MTRASEDSPAFAGDYSTALRAIGSHLEALQVEAFELRQQAMNYIVQVESQHEKLPAKSIFQRILRSHDPTNPSNGLQLIYTPEDIKRRDLDGQLRRQEGGTLDPHSLPQSLRAIGAYISAKDARLIRISKHGLFITIQYKTPVDGCHTEEFTPSSLYDVFVPMYVKRSDRDRDVNKQA